MSNGAYAGLRLATRAEGAPPKDDEHDETCTDGTGETGTKGKKKEDTTMTDTTTDTQAAVAAARAEGFKAANERNAAVVASEHYAGREKLAANLLATDLSAEQIVSALASQPNIAVAAEPIGKPDADAAARAEMRSAIGETGNSGVDANAGGSGGPHATDGAAGWKKATASINRRNGFTA